MTTIKDKKAGRVLLPEGIEPSRYDLTITPSFETFVFEAICTIDLDTSADVDTDEIKLHAKELCFVSAHYTVDGGKPVAAQEIRTNVKETTATFLFGDKLPPGKKLTLEIAYHGFLNDKMAGFYRSGYTDIHGNPGIMASTQFEALDARRAFPCWDEPARKAVFGVTLVIPATLDCFSNMPPKSTQTIKKTVGSTTVLQKQVSFLDTPKMSTYLLAFCVGEFDYLQGQTEHGVLVRVYTPPGKSASGSFALDVAMKSLDLYDDFFGIPYPLPKLDMVAIPEFAMGAMENWGLVTYREVDLLIDPVQASNQQKQRVAEVVAHELAHQWFGNLVTMAWWDDLWLNEGFASWAQNFATHAVYPSYQMWDQFTTGALSVALRLDALKSSHPIQVPIGHAEEVEQVFDGISYCKGGSVVRMIRAVLGKKAFQEGLQAYMKEHAYGNTETYDLWSAWEKASGMPVQELMSSWTEQMGFPVVKVTKETWNDDKVELELAQSWFLSDGADLTEAEQQKKWSIPVLTCTGAGVQADLTIMREPTATVTIPLDKADGWAKLNAGQEVPLRVLYSESMLERMATGIKEKTMQPVDRASILTDAYAFVKAGQMEPTLLIKLLSAYKDEDDYIVWEGLSAVLGGLDTVMSDDDAMSNNFTEFAKTFVLGLLSKVGWDATSGDGHLTVLLRAMMIGLLSAFCYSDEAVAKEASARFTTFLESPSDVKNLPSDMRTPVFKIVLKNGGEKEYEQVLGYYDTAPDNAERKHVLNSLGATLDPALKLRTMEWTTSGAVKVQDFFYGMGSVGRSSREGREISWKFYQDNFEKIKAMVGTASSSLMDACIVCCAGSFCSIEKADELDEFFREHPLPSNQRKIAQTTENMRTNGKFLLKLKDSPLSTDDFWKSVME